MSLVARSRSGRRALDLPGAVKPRARRAPRDVMLLWVSCFTLLSELLLIRWLSLEFGGFPPVRTLALVFASLGLALGAALSRRRTYLLASFGLVTVLIGMLGVGQQLGRYSVRSIAVYLSAASDLLTSYRAATDGGQLLPALPLRGLTLVVSNGALLFVIALITASFVPFGQLLRGLFDDYEHPAWALGAMLAGSLVALGLLYGMTFLPPPPAIWFSLGGFGSLALARGRRW